MIKIIEQKDCCGCWACVQVCPKACIHMKEDKEGFLYPYVDETSCIDCGLCERVCPVLHQGESRLPLATYAAKNKSEEIRRESSSGGVFTVLAETVIDAGGVVFGAKFAEDWSVVHDYVENKEGLTKFRGSKYVQSEIGDTYSKAEEFLRKGRKVLFSGTPCQIAGLKLFLRREYENLLTVDFICHGVPSPGVWQEYLTETVARMCDKNSVPPHLVSGRNTLVESVSFRNKKFGWSKYSFTLTLSATGRRSGQKIQFRSPVNRNLFLKGFLNDLYLRPSCHACPAKCLKSGSDLTIGDFWGLRRVMPELDDDKGVSVVMVNTEQGYGVLQRLAVLLWETNYVDVIRFNPALGRSTVLTNNRMRFYKERERGVALEKNIRKITKIPLHVGIKMKVCYVIESLKRLL